MGDIMNDEKYMQYALELAATAFAKGEVPVGALIVCGGEIVAGAYNSREKSKNALGHAEITAIDAACKKLGGWRLHKCDMYVTLEPCPMCAGAIINARIKRVVYGCKDNRAGAFGTLLNLNSYPFNHKPEIVGGVCEEEAAELMRRFFIKLRKT
jgi:tRNA(adenine34) deaminase